MIAYNWLYCLINLGTYFDKISIGLS